MIKLYGFGSAFGLVDPSPFVTKVDLALRIAGIDYELIAKQTNLRNAPKSKLPYIDDNGTIVADSAFIIKHLKNNHEFDLDNWLNDEQRAIAQLVGKSLDENFYWCLVHSRWIDDETWELLKKQYFGGIPFPLNKIISKIVRGGVIKQINHHGMGRHSNDEILEIANQSLLSLSNLLGNKPYFFGDQISTLDVTAYAMLCGFTLSDIENEFNDLAANYQNLVTFTQRINKQYY